MRSVVIPPSASRPPPGRVDEALSLLAHAAAPLRPDRVGALGRVLGTAGQPPARIGEVAAATGESAYQLRLVVETARKVARRAGPPDRLVAANRLLGRRLRTGADAALAVREAGLTAHPVHPATVLLAVDWFGRKPAAVAWWLPDGTSLIVPTRQRDRVMGAPGRMRYWCAARGIITVAELAARVGLDEPLVDRLIEVDPRFGRFGEHAWAVPDVGHNVVRYAVQRQLAVRPHTVQDLHAGLRAALRVRLGLAPPPVEALRAYLQAQPAYRIRGDRVRAVPPAHVLAGTDAVLVEAFRAAGTRQLSMPQLRQALMDGRYAESGARHLVRSCPILRRVGRGSYALSGVGGLPDASHRTGRRRSA